MAGVNEIVLENARALELYMRVSPQMTSWLHHFRADPNNPSRLLFRYEDLSPNPDIETAAACDKHMGALFTFASHYIGRIDSDPEITKDHPDNDYMRLYFDINLDNPKLKATLLYLTAEQINQERAKNPDFTLCYFPTKKDAIKSVELSTYEGFKDKPRLQTKLSQPFDKEISPQDLEPLMPHMAVLPSFFRKRESHHTSRGM